jgi:hypothetical protein
LPLPSTVIQSGDSLHVLVADEHADLLRDLAARPPEGPPS